MDGRTAEKLEALGISCEEVLKIMILIMHLIKSEAYSRLELQELMSMT